MASDRDDGGPAFPVPDGEAADLGVWGMSLRDWFAGQALAGLLAGQPDSDCGPRGYAYDAYQYADAMLEARQANPDNGSSLQTGEQSDG